MRIFSFLLLFLVCRTHSKECSRIATIDNDAYEWTCPDDMFCGDDLNICCILYAEPGNGEINTRSVCKLIKSLSADRNGIL